MAPTRRTAGAREFPPYRYVQSAQQAPASPAGGMAAGDGERDRASTRARGWMDGHSVRVRAGGAAG
eukprot:785944-Prymnesium_polylepis.2